MQTIVQWCQSGVITPFVSKPVPTAADPERVCYVIFTEESEEAPHFLNGRKGAYVRTDEYSHRFEARLATYEELQHLANRRQLAVARREHLFERAEVGFEEYVHQDYEGDPGTVGPIGATLKICTIPLFPTSTIVERQALGSAIEESRTERWRSVGYPRLYPRTSQHESILLLGGAYYFSMIEGDLWGKLYQALEIERAKDDRNLIHLYSLLGFLLILLQYAGSFYRQLGYDGTLQIRLRLDRIRGKRSGCPMSTNWEKSVYLASTINSTTPSQQQPSGCASHRRMLLRNSSP